ncbi:MAG: efflux RND transporter periplasmic adaptor subunit [Phycisphaerales bacterium]|nr:MAG: efflux RND transporter periplasmic adaptor subunit [Phycisphaerales bacterium]
MSRKDRRNSGSVSRNANHFGTALFVFVALAGVVLWLTGNLHFGSAGPAAASFAIEGHGHEHGNLSDGQMCEEHGFPESLCVRCNPSLVASFKARGDWCAGHDVPESQCTLCNPGLKTSLAAASASDPNALETAMCEHGVRTIECDECRYEIGVVRLESSVAEALIETASVQSMARTKTLKLVGQVQLDQTRVVDVVPSGGGQVKRLDRLLGQDVAEGDVLAVIHSVDLGQAKAEFLEVQARLELATATFEREKQLHEKKVSSKADYLSALSELKAAEAYYAASEKKLRLFGLNTEQIDAVKDQKANGQFAELLLRAPQAGTIIAQNVSAGALVEATESLYTIADLSHVWVWCDLYERDLKSLHDRLVAGRDVPAKVRVKAFEAEVFDGAVDLIGSEVDEHTRTIKVRIQVQNEERKLKPGMFAEAEIALAIEGAITAVPSSALLTDEGQTFVFQHWKGNLWMRRDVRVGEEQGDFVEVLSGIANGATVAASGAFMFKSEVLKEKMGAGCAH